MLFFQDGEVAAGISLIGAAAHHSISSPSPFSFLICECHKKYF